jgi:guanylate kinase
MSTNQQIIISNSLIERKKSAIARTEDNYAEIKARLKKQKQELRKLEDFEIVAMFRKDMMSEEKYAELMNSRSEVDIDDDDDAPDEQISTKHNKKEGTPDALS